MENPSNTQLDYERAILDKDTFRSELSKLRQQVSAGVELINNEYLRAILFSETANTTGKARFLISDWILSNHPISCSNHG